MKRRGRGAATPQTPNTHVSYLLCIFEVNLNPAVTNSLKQKMRGEEVTDGINEGNLVVK